MVITSELLIDSASDRTRLEPGPHPSCVDFPAVDNSVGMFGGAGKGSAKLSEALRSFAKVCEALRRFAKLCEALRNFAKVCEALRSFAMTQPAGAPGDSKKSCCRAPRGSGGARKSIIGRGMHI